MIVRLTQIDGKLPNLALMKLASYHRKRGDEIVFTRRTRRDMLEPQYGRVYGSAIFGFSAGRVAELYESFPGAIVGGSWNLTDEITPETFPTVESTLGIPEGMRQDYSLYPDFDGSIGYSQRGCRMKCKFCGVPRMEGKPRSVSDLAGLWRGDPYPKHIHLLDNDFFGQPEPAWRAFIEEVRAGGFKVCFNQGVNIRMITDETAKALASVRYSDDSFTTRRLYTAWDNLGDEERFFRGIDTLERCGIPPTQVMAYMLLGFDKKETWARAFYRFNKLVARGIRPYPMVYNIGRQQRLPLGGHNAPIADRTLGEFQRWVIRKAYAFIPFEHYDVNAKGRADPSQEAMPL